MDEHNQQIAAIAELIRAGDFDAGQQQLRNANPGEPASVEWTLVYAALAPNALGTLSHITAALDRAPSNQRLLRALSNANSWLVGRISRQSFAVACVNELASSGEVDAVAIARHIASQPAPAPTATPTAPPAPEPEPAPQAAAPAPEAQASMTSPGDTAAPAQPRRPEPGDIDLDELQHEAEALDKAGDRAGAIELFRRLQDYQPNDASLAANLGFLLAEAGDTGEALQQLERAVRLDPGLVEARAGLATLLEDTGRPGLAATEWEALAGIEPGNPAYILSAARCHTATGRHDRAIDLYQRVAENGQDSIREALLALGRLGLRRRDGHGAYDAFRRFVQHWPDDVTGYVGLSKALLLMDRKADAAVAAQMALGVDPDQAEARRIVELIAQPSPATAGSASQPAP